MAVLSNIKKKMSVNLASMADNGANLIAKASELSSQQLEEIEKLRQNFLTEKPNTNPESIKNYWVLMQLRRMKHIYHRFHHYMNQFRLKISLMS